jgi:hypothetical protein
MRFLSVCLLFVPLFFFVGCGEKVDTSHRKEPGFKDSAADPGAIMPTKGPPETWSTKPAAEKK